MTELKELRDKIDEIDQKMVNLFEERMDICSQVAEYKIETGKKVFDRERETAKIQSLRDGAQ